MSKKNLFLLLLLFVSLVLTACDGNTSRRKSSSAAESAEISPTATPQDVSNPKIVEAINSGRLHMALSMANPKLPGFNLTGQIEAELTNKPPAEQIKVTLPFFEIEQVNVNGKRYSRLNDEPWEISETQLSVDDLALISAEDLDEETMEELELIGRETVNGREVTHYRASKKSRERLADGLANIEKIDVWIDEDEEFIVKIQVEANQIDLSQLLDEEVEASVEFTLEYYDESYDEIVIEAPI